MAKNNIDDILEDVKQYLDEEPADPKKDYSQWLYEQGHKEEQQAETITTPPRRKKKKKKKKLLKVLLILLLAFVLVFSAMWLFFAKQPVAENDAERKSGVSTVLLAGTDAGGMRTDTMMLLNVNQLKGEMSLISLPRDTYVSGYKVPKLNSAIGIGGMEELMERVTGLIGYRPDGYVLVDLDGFVDVVNAVGGIKFDVPQDMYYHDPVQDFLIDLKAGEQRLRGKDAMGLVRYRSGYARADLERVEVQRDFMKAALKQVVNVKNLPKVPALMSIVMNNVESDMGMDNFLWLAKAMLVSDKENIRMETLPGYTKMINGGSYFVMDKAESVALFNECCNPYEAEITVEALG